MSRPQQVSSGPGSAQYRNNLLIATSCQSHSCDNAFLLLVADPASKRIFVALKDDQSPILISPKASEWPTGASADLNCFPAKVYALALGFVPTAGFASPARPHQNFRERDASPRKTSD